MIFNSLHTLRQQDDNIGTGSSRGLVESGTHIDCNAGKRIHASIRRLGRVGLEPKETRGRSSPVDGYEAGYTKTLIHLPLYAY
jgi:hypothetical protein